MTRAGSDPREALATDARGFYLRGWMVGTAGNLSARAPGGEGFWITASGRAKGELGDGDFLRVDDSGAVLERAAATDRPSAETAIHAVVYRRVPDAAAVYHVHTVESCLAAELHPGADHMPLPRLEMIKGLGIWRDDAPARLPLFVNHADVGRIAAALDARLAAGPFDVAGMLIRDHGITAWGPSTAAARHGIELLEYLLRYRVVAAMLGGRDR